MKAIFEFDAPESCAECSLEIPKTYLGHQHCMCAATHTYTDIGCSTFKRKETRASFCPLVIGGRYHAMATIASDILAIMQTFDEQMENDGDIDTPGGLEHMGDVWKLMREWRERLA